jgi:hemerythrin-like metal-binding protein
MGIIYAEQVEFLEVDEMQDTHEEEIQILNAIDKLYTRHFRGEDIQEELELKVNEYVAHVKEHFENEENLMLQYAYPNYGMHKVAHDTFIEELDYTYKQWEKTKKKIDTIINFIHRTPEWLVMHINTVDVPTSDYIYKKMKEEENI